MTYLAMPQDHEVLNCILTVMGKMKNDDGYVLASLQYIMHSVNKERKAKGHADMSAATLKSCIRTLTAIGCVEEHAITACNYKGEINKRLSKPLFKVLKDSFDPGQVALSEEQRRILELEDLVARLRQEKNV